MILKLILLTISILLYLSSEGATEGYTWSTEYKNIIVGHTKETYKSKIKNFINNLFKLKFRQSIKSLLPLDYHTWRNGELIGIAGSMLFSFIIYPEISLLSYILIVFGTFLFGFCFFYERVLQKVNFNQWYYKQGAYKIGDIELNITNKIYNLLGILGIIIYLIGIITLG